MRRGAVVAIVLVVLALIAAGVWVIWQNPGGPGEEVGPTVQEEQPQGQPPEEQPPQEQPEEKPEEAKEQPPEKQPEEKPEEQAGQAQVKGANVLVQATTGDADTFDPVHAYDTASGEVIFNVYENLIAYDGPRIDRFVPRLATEVPTVENGLIQTQPDGTMTITFPIRQGVKFHNGDPLTPEDVAYSFRRIMVHSHPDSPAWILLEDLLGVYDLGDLAEEVGDERACEMVKEAISVEGQNVVFKLPQPSATFLSRIAQGASWGAITDREFVIERGGWDEDCAKWRDFYQVDKEDLPLHNITNGTGPFKLERWTPGEEIVLVRNEEYWREPAKLERVVIKIVEEFGTRKLMMEQGDADIIVVDRQFTPQMEGLSGVRTVYNLPQLANTAVFFNYDIPVEGNPNVGSGELDGDGIPSDFFTDIDVRKGFSYAFDWETYIEQVWLGEATQARGPIPSSLPYFNPENPVYQYDLAKAEEHLKRAWRGRLWEVGFQFTVIYNAGNESRRLAAEILKDGLEKLNPKFQMEVRAEPWPTYLDNFRARRIPLFIIGWLADFPDAHNFVHPFMHSQGSFAVRQSLSVIANYDDLIEQAVRETDPEKRRELYYELQRRAYEDAIDIFLVDARGRHWERTWVDGYVYNPMWPGTNFYVLSKTAQGHVDARIQQVYPEVQLTEW
jgi:peptide/nickel transport system substrate-binding protein